MSSRSKHQSLDVMIGVNGIGMGHAIRQSVVAQFLRDRGHRVRIVTNGALRAEYFRCLGFAAYDAWMPTLVARKDQIHLTDVVIANCRDLPAGLLRHQRTRRRLLDEGIPDVFLTDYEPNAARLAYHFRKPLVAVDQQSKYRLLDLPPVGGHTRAADERRLRWFIPHAQHFFTCSFVPLFSEVQKHEIIPPVLPDAVLDAMTTNEPLVTAYFSRYFEHGPDENVSRLSTIFQRDLAKRSLRIYVQQSELERLTGLAGGNVEILPFSRTTFLESLTKSEAVVSNAGFNLIGEAIALEKPLYVLPLPTYDQYWCTDAVIRAGVGAGAEFLSADDLLAFMERLDDYKRRVERLRATHYTFDPRYRIADYVESLAMERTPPGDQATGP